MSEYSELVQRLRKTGADTFGHQSDDVLSAANAIEALMRKVEVATKCLRVLAGGVDLPSFHARAALQKMEE